MLEDKLNYIKYVSLKDKYKKQVDLISSVRLVLFISMIVSFILSYYYYPVLFKSIFIISLIFFIVMVLVHDKCYKIYYYYEKYVEIILTYMDRLNGKWKNFSADGFLYLNDKNIFLSDLDILGKNSLFLFLNVTKTVGGSTRLFHKLSNNELSDKDLLKEQEAVKEVSENIKFLIDFQVALAYYEEVKVDFSSYCASIRDKALFKKRDFIIGVVASALCVVLLILGLSGVIALQYFYGMFFFNFVMAYLYFYIYQNEYKMLDDMVRNFKGVSDIFQVILARDFSSAKLKKMQRTIQKSVDAIAKLKKLDGLNSLKNNFLANFFLNGLCCINLVVIYFFSKFLRDSFKFIDMGLLEVEELEAVCSVATLGVVFDNKCMPIRSKGVGLVFNNLRHPLLEQTVAVGNDFSGQDGVNIITGSNMGGKTSFLRTIGINLVLMNAGGFVIADTFSASYFKIFTSMRISDDIESGISTFYGELLRIKEALEYIDNGKMLVLVDEIFKGTNYQDRMYGAKKVIKKFSDSNNVLAFITTHDFELCEETGVQNYYVREFYENDHICFDYKIRSGKCNSTNAKYLMEKIGIK